MLASSSSVNPLVQLMERAPLRQLDGMAPNRVQEKPSRKAGVDESVLDAEANAFIEELRVSDKNQLMTNYDILGLLGKGKVKQG